MERVYEMIEIIQKAYPQGINAVYQDLIGCLKEHFTTQNLAALLSYVNGFDMNIVKRDILHYESSDHCDDVMQALVGAGFKQN